MVGFEGIGFFDHKRTIFFCLWSLAQLRDTLFSFTKIPLQKSSTVIVSGFDSFHDDAEYEERTATIRIMLQVLSTLQNRTSCTVILGVRGRAFVTTLKQYFERIEQWEEPLYQCAMK